MSLRALCLRCRLDLCLEPSAFLFHQKRFRHSCDGRFNRRQSRELDYSRKYAPPRSPTIPWSGHTVGPSSHDQIPQFFVQNVRAWTTHPRVLSRLCDFGIPTQHTRPLLFSFAAAVERGELHGTAEHWERYGLTRFGQGLRELSIERAENEVDIIYSTIFFTWASEPKQQLDLVKVLPQIRPNDTMSLSPTADQSVLPFNTMSHIQRLSQVASRQYPAEEFPHARRMVRRIIMHVGPTNSGKTHHALRALAAAPTGVYAGPLRLLAHEIWERLNLGEITPLGIDNATSQLSADSRALSKIPDYFNDHPSLIRALHMSKRGNLAFARQCNMITGEEQKVVSDSAPLISCTVEMLSMTKYHDVAVVDEIQMISDPERGAGWTSAVLGLCAREIHLCGEEAAVPVVQALLRETGDEIEVRKYERLTPLNVEEKSLKSDYDKVRKGDCVVAFSRSGIFGIKSKIERKTGMRCAVVYGKLPPEVRSEQARLFNDPDSGYDVMIGSDAIGMGLNLKIRRVIFDAVAKWSEGSVKPLSTSQVKQIAGRAGRYGLLQHSKTSTDSPAGYTTTLHQSDLPFLRQALVASMQPLRYARLGVRSGTFASLAHVLPRGASTFTIYEAHVYVGRLGANYRYVTPDKSVLKEICDMVDEHGGALRKEKRSKQVDNVTEVLQKIGSSGSLTIEDRMLFCLAPVAWRDPRCLSVMRRLVKMYRATLEVDLDSAIRGFGFMEALEGIESLTNIKQRDIVVKGAKRWNESDEEIGKINQATLGLLEAFHKVLAMYLWMSYRNPASWGNREEVGAVKLRVEHALDRCLEGLSREPMVRSRRIQSEPRKREQGRRLDKPEPQKLAYGQ